MFDTRYGTNIYCSRYSISISLTSLGRLIIMDANLLPYVMLNMLTLFYDDVLYLISNWDNAFTFGMFWSNL